MPLETPTSHLSANFERIQPNNLLTTLEFANWPQLTSRPNFVDSLFSSHWYQHQNGRMILELRHPNNFNNLTVKTINSTDYDDTYNSTSQQHIDRLARPATSPALIARRIHISPEEAHQIYKLSQLTLEPGSEPRYTPQFDLSLLSIYAKFLEKGQSPDQALANLVKKQKELQALHQQIGDRFLQNLHYDQDIVNTMLDQPTTKYLYQDFIQEFLSNNQPDNINIIITRGYPGGPLGQADKLRTNGGIDPRICFVLYTSDLKPTAFQEVFRLCPNAQRLTHYEDNPTEIDSIMKIKWPRPVTTIRVRNGKRQNDNTKTPPTVIENDREIYQSLAA